VNHAMTHAAQLIVYHFSTDAKASSSHFTGTELIIKLIKAINCWFKLGIEKMERMCILPQTRVYKHSLGHHKHMHHVHPLNYCN